MPDPTSAAAPPSVRVLPPRCPQCDRTTTIRLEHVVKGDLVTSGWLCSCGATWPTERSLAAPGADDTRPSRAEIVLDDLRDLVAALDRRLPHGNARRERLVAAMSATLRQQAIDRITRLETGPAL